MSDLACLGWGMMIGSWITSLWIMRKDASSPIDEPRRIMCSLAAKIERGRRFAPDCTVEAWQDVRIGEHPYRVTIAPIDQ